jgi:hypothetical protein
VAGASTVVTRPTVRLCVVTVGSVFDLRRLYLLFFGVFAGSMSAIGCVSTVITLSPIVMICTVVHELPARAAVEEMTVGDGVVSSTGPAVAVTAGSVVSDGAGECSYTFCTRC